MPVVTASPGIERPQGRRSGPQNQPGRLEVDRRDLANTRVRRTSRAVAILATGAAAVLGLIVSKEIPGTTATASAATAVSSTTSETAGTGSSSTSQESAATGSGDSSGNSTSASATTPTTAATTTTTAPSSTKKSATVVSGGTGS